MKNVKHYAGVMLVVISIIVFLAGIGLLVWCGIGQYIAQINYDGQYLTIRTINDVSLWGYTGFAGLVLGPILFVVGCNMQ